MAGRMTTPRKWLCCILVAAFVVSTAIQTKSAQAVDTLVWRNEFSWKNCNKTPVPIVMKDLSLSHNPITLGKYFWTSVVIVLVDNVTIPEHKGEPVEIHLSLKMKVGDDFTELCDFAVAREVCYFENVCQTMKSVETHCPKKLRKRLNNCTCPFNKKTYDFSGSNAVPVKIPPPPFTIEGFFRITMTIRSNGRDIGCFAVSLCVGRC